MDASVPGITHNYKVFIAWVGLLWLSYSQAPFMVEQLEGFQKSQQFNSYGEVVKSIVHIYQDTSIALFMQGLEEFNY